MAYISHPDPHEAFRRTIQAKHWCAKAYVWIRGWGDPAPIYVIAFRNGVEFTGTDKEVVTNDARAYHNVVLDMTGESP